MMKSLLLISAVFIISNCVSSTPELKPTQFDPDNAKLFDNAELSENAELFAKAEISDNAELTENTEKAEKEQLVCTRERVTGSRIKIKRCRTQAQIEDERRRAEAFINRAKSVPQSKPEPKG